MTHDLAQRPGDSVQRPRDSAQRPHDWARRTHDWVDAGLITPEQAAAIAKFEDAHEQMSGRLPRWVEPLAYLGVALVAVAFILFGIQVWDQIAPLGRVGAAALLTALLLIAGGLLRRSVEPPARRAASFALVLSLAGVAATVGLVLADVVEASETATVVLTTGLTTLAAGAIYAAVREALQQVGLAVATASFVIAVPSVLEWGDGLVVPLLLAALGLVWLALTRAGLMTPLPVGWVIGSVLTLAVGLASADGDSAIWAGVGVAVALGLVALATALDSRWVLGVAVVGLLVWIPTTVTLLFEGSVAVPIAILVTGVVTLGVVVLAVRRPR
jgi:hypothetical protein